MFGVFGLRRIQSYDAVYQLPLIYQILRHTSFTTRFNNQKFYFLSTMNLRVLCGSQNKQPLFPYTALIGWFL